MPNAPIILFDGACNLCNGAVAFFLRQDRSRRLRFAPLQSVAGQRLLTANGLPTTGFQSFVLLHNGGVYQRSSAALKAASLLPWYWQWTQVFWIVPRPFRDGVYNFIARNRYRWFGKKDRCMVPGADVQSRFLPEPVDC